jgi:hypothetical protein
MKRPLVLVSSETQESNEQVFDKIRKKTNGSKSLNAENVVVKDSEKA